MSRRNSGYFVSHPVNCLVSNNRWQNYTIRLLSCCVHATLHVAFVMVALCLMRIQGKTSSIFLRGLELTALNSDLEIQTARRTM